MGQSGIKPDEFFYRNYTVGNSNMMMKEKYLKQQKNKSVDLAETKKS